MKRITALSLTAFMALGLTACGDAEGAQEGAYPAGPVKVVAPADPGSGWDLTARAIAQDLGKEEIVTTALPVENRPGAVGTVFLAEMIERHKGKDDVVAVTSMAMNVNTTIGQTDYSYEDVTMIAGISAENYVVVANADGDISSLTDVTDALSKDAGSVPVGAATDDQFPFSLIVDAAGGDAKAVNYVTYEGGGEQSAALLAGDIDVAIAGYSEFQPMIESGDVKVLAVLSEERVEGIDAPTAKEQGIDVSLANWRGLYGPPDMPAEAVDYWADSLEELSKSETWKATAEKNQWTTQFMRGDEFVEYVADAQATVDEGYKLVNE